MGGLFSSNIPRSFVREHDNAVLEANSKRQRISSSLFDEEQRLIPYFPDELSMQILARIPKMHYLALRLVSRKWKLTIMGHQLYDTRRDIGCSEEWLYVLTRSETQELNWHALDPLSKQWRRLPPLPKIPSQEVKKPMWDVMEIAETIKRWLGKKDFSEKLPFCGSAICSMDRCLYMIGGFYRQSTMSRAWRYSAVRNEWEEIPPMQTGRAYSKTELLGGKLYVVGGVCQAREGLSTLRCGEVFDTRTGTWTRLPSMPFSKAQAMPTAFLSTMLKPLATGMAAYGGRLCVPQSLYVWPFIVDAGGEVYDPDTDAWVEMPAGMAEGWPARKAGTKLSVVVDGELYAFDQCGSHESGRIMVYDACRDVWRVGTGKMPVCDGDASESPNLLAGFHGKVHVVTKDARSRVVVMRADAVRDSDASGWEELACREFSGSELVGCQVIDL